MNLYVELSTLNMALTIVRDQELVLKADLLGIEALMRHVGIGAGDMEYFQRPPCVGCRLRYRAAATQKKVSWLFGSILGSNKIITGTVLG